MDYIKKEKVLNILKDRYDVHQENNDGACADTLYDMIDEIKALPTAEVMEVRHGHKRTILRRNFECGFISKKN